MVLTSELKLITEALGKLDLQAWSLQTKGNINEGGAWQQPRIFNGNNPAGL